MERFLRWLWRPWPMRHVASQEREQTKRLTDAMKVNLDQTGARINELIKQLSSEDRAALQLIRGGKWRE